WFSLVCRTTLRATIWTLITTIMLAGGHWLLMALCCYVPAEALSFSSRDLEYVLKFQIGQTPPVVLGLLGIHGDQVRGSRRAGLLDVIGFATRGLGPWSVAGLALAVLVHHRFEAIPHRLEIRRRAHNPFENGQPVSPAPVAAPPQASEPLDVVVMVDKQ